PRVRLPRPRNASLARKLSCAWMHGAQASATGDAPACAAVGLVLRAGVGAAEVCERAVVASNTAQLEMRKNVRMGRTLYIRVAECEAARRQRFKGASPQWCWRRRAQRRLFPRPQVRIGAPAVRRKQWPLRALR